MPNRVLYKTRTRVGDEGDLRVVDTTEKPPKKDTRRPGALRDGEDPRTTRAPPAPMPTSTAKGNGYGPGDGSRANGITHWGVDIARSPDEDVIAPERSVVVAVWKDNETAPFVGYGPGGVLLKGESGIHHLLGHLDPNAWTDASRPTKGEVFERGELVGHTAPTGSPGVGRATPHVHWEVRVEPIDSPSTRGNNTLDPRKWLVGTQSRTLAEVKSGGGGIWLLLLFLAAASRRR